MPHPTPIKIEIYLDDHALACAAADRVCAWLRREPSSLLVVPTGRTPENLYHELVRRVQMGETDFSQTHLIEMDDYLGIPAHDPRCLFNWLDRLFLTPAGFRRENLTRFDPTAPDLNAEMARIETALDARGGIGLCVLGIGPNGHLGYNEPGSPLHARVQALDLTPESIASSARYWGNIDQVPTRGITLGLGTMLAAREILLLANGDSKREILTRALHGPVTTALPASVLQTHPNVTVMADRAAGAELNT